jgi:MarR family transcriptional regulator, organic hydroperoxide resistance regulator
MARRGRACDAWQVLLRVLAAERSRLPGIAAELGLSQAQCQVLERLDPHVPVAMCRVAESLDCDPSNVTGIVDRLEAQGIVERRADAADRRVKKLVLTPAGLALRARLLARLSEPPSGIQALPTEDQERLFTILRRAFAGEHRKPS